MTSVLLAESSTTRRRAISAVLSAAGFTVHPVPGFEEAHAFLERLPRSSSEIGAVAVGWPDYSEPKADEIFDILTRDALEHLPVLILADSSSAGAVNWTITQRSHAQGQDVDLVPAVLVGAIISSLLTLPLALPFQASMRDVGLLAILGLVQLAIPCALAVICARVLKAPEIALLALLEVIFGILLAWVGAGEAPGATVLTGGALVIGALVANELMGWKQRA